MKDYKITIQIKNNYLLKAMQNMGFENAAELSKASGVTAQCIGKYLNLQKTPYYKPRWQDELKLAPSIIKISKILKKLPEDLFPSQHIYKGLKKYKISLEADSNQIKKAIGSSVPAPQQIEFNESATEINRVISSLGKREEIIIRRRFGFDGPSQTLEELSKEFKVSREKIRQIEHKALNRLRYHKIRNILKEHREVVYFDNDNF